MSTRTVAECAEEALRKIGVASSGQPISADDFAVASAAVQQALLELESRVQFTLSASDEVDALYYDAISIYAAALMCPNYGTETINKMTPEQAQEASVRKILVLRPQDEPTNPIPTNYF
jgi:hypothetical protein